MKRQNAFCSFCRKSYVDIGPLVEGPNDELICGDCVELCRTILKQEARRRRQCDPSRPSAIERLQQHVGACLDVETKPTIDLLAAVASHAESLSSGSVPAQSLIVLVGPSAAAGVLVTKLIASAMEAPFWLIDRERLSRGDTFFSGDSELFEILKIGEFDLDFFHKTVAYVPQFDDPAVQEALSRLIQGGSDDKSLTDIGLDSRKILFMCGGAFVGLDEIAARRGQQSNEAINLRDLLSWGMLPDLVGRTHAALAWNALDEQTLFRIASIAEVELPTSDGE
ncbi:MAG TPA: ClpX C4-type zinc finger protein [Pirellulaceae bacterium]|nr:ClpX C4-type zinc finger protein [Pirellulaceae bacterium]